MLGRGHEYRGPAPEARWDVRRGNGSVPGGRKPSSTGKGRASSRLPALLACLLFLGASGCTYLRYRGEDALDMIDIGVTLSTKPGFAAYYDFIPLIPVGVGYVDGYFVGVGGGRVGWMRHYEESIGLGLWGQEKVGFGEFSKEKPETLNFQRSGLAGMIHGPFPGPDYLISCPHYLHVGWIGLVGSPRYLQGLDFALGWTTLDICSDDGCPRGRWRWPWSQETQEDSPDGKSEKGVEDEEH